MNLGARGGVLNNCTLTGNWATNNGGGVGNATLTDCIVYYNTANGEGDNYSGGNFSYSCTSPLPDGVGNIDAEPQLASASHLSAGSPCRGAGSASFAGAADIDGEPWANPPSIGCDEYHMNALIGPLTVAIQASYTIVAQGFAVDFQAQIGGRVGLSRCGLLRCLISIRSPLSSPQH